MNTITLYQPKEIVFGVEVIEQLPADCQAAGYHKILFITATPLKSVVDQLAGELESLGIKAELLEYTIGEPTVDYFNNQLQFAKAYGPDCVIGVGGGSVLDTTKLIAALHDSTQNISDVFGTNMLKTRNSGLICIPTTSGTGSEVSPNAILLDEKTSEKKGVISPFLIPDACYIDPALTVGLPAKLTAETALDALSHCIEAYTNKHSHPIVDNYALEGIRLIAENLEAACKDGSDLEARSALSLGSMYGGLCLGPVNTAAVHALSYGLGGKYHVSHGLANAILLPEVMKFNMDSNLEKYWRIALAVGVPNLSTKEDTALKGIERIREIAMECGIPQKLSDIGIDHEDVDELASLAMNVTRLLVNNPKKVTLDDAVMIYNSLY